MKLNRNIYTLTEMLIQEHNREVLLFIQFTFWLKRNIKSENLAKKTGAVTQKWEKLDFREM